MTRTPLAAFVVLPISLSLLASCGGPGADGDVDASRVELDSAVPDPDSGPVGEDAGGPGEDGGGPGQDAGADAAVPPEVPSDYIGCTVTSDCPEGTGECIEVVPLEPEPAAGAVEVSVQSIFPGLATPGVCSRICTQDPDACSDLVQDSGGDAGGPWPYTCQLVYAGRSPYPSPAPAFPFDDQIVTSDMTNGAPFAALCRPRSGADEAALGSFCASCTTTDDCATGVCWDLAVDAEAAGTAGSCLAPCGAEDSCPLGFSCSAGDGPHLCLPFGRTCGDCSDLDGDGYGLGNCDADGTATSVDCDDDDAVAYYDPLDMAHSFPDYCGPFDENCNGLSDEVEQSDPAEYGAWHCGGCNQPCAGPALTDGVVTGTLVCAADDEGGATCGAECFPEQVDCDGDLANGCETLESDPAYVFYLDADSDGYGDLAQPGFFCTLPVGYAADSTDCNDLDDAIHPGAPESCDGADRNCDGLANQEDAQGCTVFHEDGDDDGYGGAPTRCLCEAAAPWSALDADDCNDLDDTIHPGAQEFCDDADRNCDGLANQDDASGCTVFYVDRDGDGYGYDGMWGADLPRCLCAPSAPWVSTNDRDCNDGDASAYPGSPFQGVETRDYNCDGSITHLYTGNAWCDAVSCFTAGVGVDGWNVFAGGEPDCGGVGQWGGCTGMLGICSFGDRTQLCF